MAAVLNKPGGEIHDYIQIAKGLQLPPDSLLFYGTDPIALYLSHPTVLLASRYTGQIRLLTLASTQGLLDHIVNPSVIPVRSDC